MAEHSNRAHAILSASGAHRWMHCTPSARLEEGFPNKETVYSKEGTKAHELAEQLLRDWYARNFLGDAPDISKDKEMQEAVLPYVEYVAETFLKAQHESKDAVLFLEHRLDMRSMIPEGFGTGDAIIVSGNTLHVIDLKYGKGVRVDAQNNEQLRCYGMAAFDMFQDLYEDIDTIMMTIVQPRLDHISTDTQSLSDLLSWVEHDLKPKAKEAFEGNGEYNPGDHCRFCKAGAVCRARAEMNLQMTKEEFPDPELLGLDEFAQILQQVEQVKSWIDSVMDHALQQAEQGDTIPGFKLVEGRSVRVYTDEDKVLDELKQQGYQEALLYEPRKLLGITKMEKLLGKKLFKDYLEKAGLVIKPKGKPTLVQESDKRPAIIPDALRDFEDVK